MHLKIKTYYSHNCANLGLICRCHILSAFQKCLDKSYNNNKNLSHPYINTYNILNNHCARARNKANGRCTQNKSLLRSNKIRSIHSKLF